MLRRAPSTHRQVTGGFFAVSFWGAVAMASVAAVPAPTEAADPLDLVDVAPGVLVHPGETDLMTGDNAGGIANLGVVIGERAIAVIDPGGSRVEGDRLRAAIRARSDLPIRYVIMTHMHPDHVFGAAAFARDTATVVGHDKLPRALAARGTYYLETNRARMGDHVLAGTEIVAPGLLVEDAISLDLGGRMLTVTAWPTAHTDNDLTVMDGRTATLFAGDLVFLEHIPTLDGSITGWLEVLDRLAALDAQRVVPGHGPPEAPWPEAAVPTKRYLSAVVAGVRAEIAAGRSLAQAVATVARDEAGTWALAPVFHPRNVTAAYAELEWE